MPQAALLVDVLKKALRERGLTYAGVAKGLGLSESSIKRTFSQETMSLDRLESICALMELEIADLLDLTRAAEGRVTELQEEVEKTLVSDPKLLLVAVLAINHWSAAAMLETYRFSEAELVGMLTQLDRLGIIDLLPGNRIKVRLARNFTWRKGGPIQRFFEERVQEQFFGSAFLDRGEIRVMVQGSLSAKSNELLQQRVRKLAEEFDALTEEDRSLDRGLREGTTLVIAMRPWEFSQFAALRRNPGKHPSRPAGAAFAPGTKVISGLQDTQE
jgi:DNA-binding Xre family transcriptional regulator